MSGSGQDTMVSSEVEVAVDPGTAFAAFTEELDLWWVRGPIKRAGDTWDRADDNQEQVGMSKCQGVAPQPGLITAFQRAWAAQLHDHEGSLVWAD